MSLDETGAGRARSRSPDPRPGSRALAAAAAPSSAPLATPTAPPITPPMALPSRAARPRSWASATPALGVPGTSTWMLFVEMPTARRLPTARSAEALSTKSPTMGVIHFSPLCRTAAGGGDGSRARAIPSHDQQRAATTATISQPVSLISSADRRALAGSAVCPLTRDRVRHAALEQLHQVDDLALLAFGLSPGGSLSTSPRLARSRMRPAPRGDIRPGTSLDPTARSCPG